ncbi:PEPxxWA-CTERM sorting domain-containing protein [Sphingomonas nostoxanthinifaciens]|nr:PEPxxWA-CTERM sorting domain-containing protein [Sphingomonas nostoxanthinifaciens]
MIGSVSVSPIRLTNGSGVATLVDGAPGPAPSDQFRIVGSATLQVSASVLTPYPDSGASASFESIYDPRGYTYCSNCGGGGASFDKTVWVYSNSDINVTLNTSTLLEFTSYGSGNGTTVFGSVEAETDPVFSIDDPAYSAFTVVGVPTGSPPPGAGGGSGSVPEPASWAMMLAGFGLAGSSMRTRKRQAALAA